MKHVASKADWNRLQERNKPILKTFFNNVDFLSRSRYGSRNKALIALYDRGFAGESKTVTCYKKGQFTDCKLSALQKWSDLFDISVIDMLSVDYSKDQDK